jgi:predicted NUDIX family NTP pyrophosphohydrolase
MPRKSAGLLVYRVMPGEVLEVFLAHPGGPIWARKDAGVWTIPKGEFEESEKAWDAARREFQEEIGERPPELNAVELGAVTLKSGKTIQAWAVEGEVDPRRLRSNTFTMEWPPHSGERREFPEVDRAAWFALAEARLRIHSAQIPFLDALEEFFRGGRSR